jgi:two-component system LytT family response regulator
MTGEAMLRVLVVDDEAPARRKIVRLLSREPNIEVAQAASGEAAVTAIQKNNLDLVFLDVQMPGMDGFQVVEQMPKAHVPRIVFVTAHDQYAIRAFDVHAFDYLLKPVSEDRFRRVLQRARHQRAEDAASFAARLRELMAQVRREQAFPERLLIHEASRSFFVPVREISWIEAERNYLLIHCGAKVHTLRGTLDAIQGTLNPQDFARVNRSGLVRLDAVRELLRWFHGEYKVILHDGSELRWTRRFVAQRPELLKRF